MATPPHQPPIFKRICLVIFDSLGVGALPDAASYGDEGANTLEHVAQKIPSLKLQTLSKLGLWHLTSLKEKQEKTCLGFFTRMKEISKGKDTTTGHWEMMGHPLKEGLSLFPNGFPEDLLKEFLKQTGLKGYLGNKPASGTVIIDELGEEHCRTGFPIVYTSADSVFQIAWHEEKFGLQRLYEICGITRKILNQTPYKIGRVIARPFVGTSGNFKRTENRKDFSLKPWQETALTGLQKADFQVTGIGKIPHIFDGEGITKSLEAHNDQQGIEQTLHALETCREPGLIFTNFNDLDMLYGHRRNGEGYANQLEFLDAGVQKIIEKISNEDLLLISADHGNDPTFKGTDHTREYVPLLAYSPCFGEAPVTQRRLPDRESFCDLGQTILSNFQLPFPPHGKSFLNNLRAHLRSVDSSQSA